MILYADVLLAVNTAVNYFILLSVDKILKCEARLYRLLLGAASGAIFSLIVFCGTRGSLILFGVRIISSAVITIITFGLHNVKEYVKKLIATVSVSLIYCGGFILVYQIFKPPKMYIINDVLYLDVDPALLIGLTAVIYLILLLINRLLRERLKSSVVNLTFTVDQQEYACMAKIDTGCSLTEPFSGAPVILADDTVFKTDSYAQRRIIPYHTVNSSSFLFAVKADRVIIDKQTITKTVYIASIGRLNDPFHAIINPEIIR